MTDMAPPNSPQSHDAAKPYERRFRVRWIRLSGTDLWHRPSRDAHEAVLCGNPPSGIVVTKTSIEEEPPGPKCPDCEATLIEEARRVSSYS